jgi:glycosyltransferase involved in cell wall biosynthesis
MWSRALIFAGIAAKTETATVERRTWRPLGKDVSVFDKHHESAAIKVIQYEAVPARRPADEPSCDVLPHGAMPRDVVLFSTADWDHPFWTNKQRVACELAQAGFRVLYVDSLGLRRPTAGGRDLARIARRLRSAATSPRQVAENLWVCSPLVLPWHSRAGVRALNDRLLGGLLRRIINRLGFSNPLLWTYNPLVSPLLAKLPRSLVVYHCVDDLTAAPHMPASAIETAEAELAQTADLIFTTSPRLQQRMSARRRQGTHFLPNVADYEHFSLARTGSHVPADLARIPPPRIGFIGALSSYKVDFGLIAAVARARPDWHWVLIGQVGEGQPDTSIETLRLPNVHLLGPRPYAQLPDYLRGFDVAAIPSVASDYTASMFPLKFFEYLAAGRPVVGANVPALNDYAGACRLVSGSAEFISAVERILAGDVPDAWHCEELARQFTWRWRTQQMLTLLQEAWTRRLSERRGVARTAA